MQEKEGKLYDKGMATVGWIVLALVVATLVIAVLYVSATYLLRAYDEALACAGKVSPSYQDPQLLPDRGSRRGVVLLEVLATWAFIWLFFVGIFPPIVRQRRRHAAPIILIHGLNHNRSAWIYLKRKLIKAGFGATYSFNLRRGHRSVEFHTARLARFAEKVERMTGARELILIGHSMGGLVASLFAERVAPSGKVTHVVTLGSPLHGTRLAFFTGGNCRNELGSESAFSTELVRLISASLTTHYFHIATWYDNIVFPPQSALIGKRPGNERIYSHLGHMGLLLSPKVAAQIIDWLRSTVPLRFTRALTFKPDWVPIRPERLSEKSNIRAE